MRLRKTKVSIIALAISFALNANAETSDPPAAEPATAPSTVPTPVEAVTPDTSAASDPAAPANSPAPIDQEAEAAARQSPDVSAETAVEAPVSPIKNSKALDESSLSNPSGHDEFKRPLLFAPEDNGLQPDNPQIKWDMDASGKRINMGGLKLTSSLIGARIDQTGRGKAPDDIRLSTKGSTSVILFSFNWPTVLSKTGTVSIESLDGKSSWSMDVTEEMRSDWRSKLTRYKSSVLRAHQGSQWGFPDLPSSALKPFRSGKPFRVCLAKTESELEKLRVCSVPYEFQSIGTGRTQIAPVKPTSSANVYLHGKPIGLRGLVNLPLGKEVALEMKFADGESIALSSQPENLDLLDVVESTDGREIILTGRSAMPLGKKKIVSRPSSHFWAPTGIEQDTIWQVALPKDTPTIRILGAFNLPFTFLFRYEKLPTEKDRVFVREATSTGSYSAHPLIFGWSPKLERIESLEESVEKVDDHRFEWTFGAPTKGARNRSRVTLLGGSDASTKWTAHHTLYRGFPFEASARLSGVITSQSQIVFIGEVAASGWLESLGFTQNDLLSRQRWGATVRYFQTLTPIKSPATSTTPASSVSFSSFNADLKYNVVRGIWNRDQLYGIMGSLEQISVGMLKGTLAGGGVYWARTMPRIFADLFDRFPLLDYSKYVDVEFVLYPVSFDPKVRPGTSFNLNFHGKVFWTQRLYGEAGFGFRSYEFSDASKNAKFGLQTLYGNVGVGIIF